MSEQQFLQDLEKKLWTSANKLLPSLDAAVYKHVVLGLVFLKYVSDAFEMRRQELLEAFRDPAHDYYLGEDADEFIEEELENRDYYTEKNVFWVPAAARWQYIQDNIRLSIGSPLPLGSEFKGAGKLLDDTMELIEKENAIMRKPHFTYLCLMTSTTKDTCTCRGVMHRLHRTMGFKCRLLSIKYL